jgi:signal transduction histidine kinase
VKFLTALQHSLAARLLGVFLVTGAAVLLVITLAWGVALKHQWNTHIRVHLVQYIDYVNRDLGDPPDPRRADDLVRILPINIYIKGPNIDYSSSDQRLDLSDVDFDSDEQHDDDAWRRARMTTATGLRFAISDDDDRTLVRTIANGYHVYYELRRRQGATGRGSAVRPARFLFVGTLALLFVLLGLCYWVIHRLLRPVRDIHAGVARMGRGELDHRIATRRNDDLGDLTLSINNMAADIEQMLDAKRQMLLGISHELRSPITRAKVSLALLDASTTRTRLQEDILEMETLVTELLESERLNSRHSVLNLETVAIAALIDSVVAQSFSGQVTVQVAHQSPTLRLDETRVRLLLRNLLGNAVRYGGATPPQLRAQVAAATLTIEVEDTGVGIAPEHLDSLTDPFYRVDPSRSRATGGFGLGLYLCRLICEAHGGTLTVTSKLSLGTTVTARLESQSHD